jgi:LEA14-like dessication related protein
MKFVYALLLMISLYSCSDIKDPKFTGIENLQVTKLGLKGSIFKMDLLFNNPNKFGLQLSAADGDVWLDNNFLGHFVMDTKVRIGKNEDFRLPVTLEIDMGKILKNSMLALLAPEVNLRLEGKARLGKGIISINYPFHYEGKHNISHLLNN